MLYTKPLLVEKQRQVTEHSNFAFSRFWRENVARLLPRFLAFHKGGQKVHEEPADLGVASFMAQWAWRSEDYQTFIALHGTDR